jgi:DTW domain-containing protein YfiP
VPLSPMRARWALMPAAAAAPMVSSTASDAGEGRLPAADKEHAVPGREAVQHLVALAGGDDAALGLQAGEVVVGQEQVARHGQHALKVRALKRREAARRRLPSLNALL